MQINFSAPRRLWRGDTWSQTPLQTLYKAKCSFRLLENPHEPNSKPILGPICRSAMSFQVPSYPYWKSELSHRHLELLWVYIGGEWGAILPLHKRHLPSSENRRTFTAPLEPFQSVHSVYMVFYSRFVRMMHHRHQVLTASEGIAEDVYSWRRWGGRGEASVEIPASIYQPPDQGASQRAYVSLNAALCSEVMVKGITKTCCKHELAGRNLPFQGIPL